MKTWIKLALAGLCVTNVAVGCELATNLDDYTFEGSTSGTGGAGGEADAAPKCGVTFPPPPPKGTPGGDVEFVTAMRSINLGEKAAVGLDLDHMCTCHDDGPSCKETKPQCDDAEGRDNAAALIFSTLTKILQADFSSDFFSARVNEGAWSVLFRVRGYNGEANDTQVEVDWYPSPSFVGPPQTAPLWNGTDLWQVSSTSLENSDVDKPLFRDTGAYVANSMLVASLPEAALTLTGGLTNITIHLTGAGLLAKISKDAPLGGYQLTQGQVVGRWKSADVFASVGTYRDSMGKPICKGDSLYSTMKGFICASRDILAGQGTPATPCDSLSFGVGFSADPAKLGSVVAPPAPSPGCPPATNPTGDDCAP